MEPNTNDYSRVRLPAAALRLCDDAGTPLISYRSLHLLARAGLFCGMVHDTPGAWFVYECDIPRLRDRVADVIKIRQAVTRAPAIQPRRKQVAA